MVYIPHNPNEILAVVDKNNRIIGEATRKLIHKEGLMHREAYVYLLCGKKVLLNKRKDNHLWDHSVGCHFPRKQTYKQALVRELKEELGLRLVQKNLKKLCERAFKNKKRGNINNRIAKTYIITKNIPRSKIKPDHKEVEKAEYFDKEGIKKLLKGKKLVTGSSQYILKKYILPRL